MAIEVSIWYPAQGTWYMAPGTFFKKTLKLQYLETELSKIPEKGNY
jgi:hypothetical protein